MATVGANDFRSSSGRRRASSAVAARRRSQPKRGSCTRRPSPPPTTTLTVQHPAAQPSFEYFEKNYRFKKTMEYSKIIEKEGNLFEMPNHISLAHCVAEDMAMRRGIAVTFRQKFNSVPELLAQRAKTGNVAFLKNKGRYIYYMVTKRKSTMKPTIKTMFKSMVHLAVLIKKHGITKLAIPRIGCGLDRLNWSEVKNMLEYVFKDSAVAITVCNFQQSHGRAAYRK